MLKLEPKETKGVLITAVIVLTIIAGFILGTIFPIIAIITLMVLMTVLSLIAIGGILFVTYSCVMYFIE